MATIAGKYLTIEQYNGFFSDVTTMLFAYYDTHEYADSVIILGSYLKTPVSTLRILYPNKKIIIYQLEQMVGNPTWWPVDVTISNMRDADEIWDYDILNIKFMRLYYGITNVKFLPFRFTSALKKLDSTKLSPEHHDIDVLFYGTLNQRRFNWIQHLQNTFYDKVSIVTINGIGGAKLDEYITRSKIILNIHAFEPYNRQEQVRMFYPIINGKCVLSEVTQINHLADSIIECQLETLCNSVVELLKDNAYNDIGIKARESFVSRTSSNSAYKTHIEHITSLDI